MLQQFNKCQISKRFNCERVIANAIELKSGRHSNSLKL